jgi:hypothetical protein
VARGKSLLRPLTGAPGGGVPGGGEAARPANRMSREARPRRGKGSGDGREEGPDQGEGNDESSSKWLEEY